MRRLAPATQRYAWGSADAIPRFLGQDPPGGPVAEAWFGAHPAAPSTVEGDGDLRAYLGSSAERLLGSDVVNRFGPRLPYLLKLIAPARPLSLQVHPNLEQARLGYAREEEAGIERARRNYADANHKPELVYALTTFEAVAGFRAPRRAAELLAGLGVPLADEMLQMLRADPSARGVRAAFTCLLDPDRHTRAEEVDAVAAACTERAAAGLSPSPRADATVGRLAADYPGDPGAVAALLLNPVTLHPGEVMFVPAGTVHAYMSGFAVEIMANSDNVLRAGLTTKHMDVPEVLATVDTVAAPPIRLAPEMFDEHTGVFYAPVDDFELSVTNTDGAEIVVPGRGPRVLLVLDGEVDVATGLERLHLPRGGSAFVGADEPPVHVSGSGTVVQAGVP